MSAPNFRENKNFPLYAHSDSEFYCKVCDNCKLWLPADETTCPECGEPLNSAVIFDELEAGYFYQTVREALDDLNRNLIFHNIELESGYYGDTQFYVSLSADADNAGFDECGKRGDPYYWVDNESTKYYFDMCRSQAIRKYEAEQRKVEKLLAQTAKRFGFVKLGVTARFSNGETLYQICA